MTVLWPSWDTCFVVLTLEYNRSNKLNLLLSWRALMLSSNFVIQSIVPYLLSKGQFKITCIQFVNAYSQTGVVYLKVMGQVFFMHVKVGGGCFGSGPDSSGAYFQNFRTTKNTLKLRCICLVNWTIFFLLLPCNNFNFFLIFCQNSERG